MAAATNAHGNPAIESLLGPQLTEEQARAVYREGEESVVFAILTLAKMAAPSQSETSPSTPSGLIPV